MSSPDPLVSRRRAIQLAGTVGLAAVVGGCASARPSVGPSESLSSPPATPPLSATTSSGPSPAPAAPLEATSAAMLCRDALRAQPARPGGHLHTITRMTLHHSGVVLGDNSKAPGRLRQHQHYHQDQLGWIDIAYHVSVDRAGNIYELRKTELVGDTATDYDPTGHFLVLCEGDFDTEAISERQLRGAAIAFAWAAQTFHVPSSTLASHRDFAPTTSCPGANLYAHITSGGLKRQIDEVMAAGPVNLQSLCGPNAVEMVAAIEAG